MSPSRHPSSELLSAFLDGEAGAAERQRIAGHLAGCEACRLRLESARQLVGGLRRLGAAAVPPPPRLAAAVAARVAALGAQREERAERAERAAASPWAGRRGVFQAAQRWWRTAGAWWSGLPPLRPSLSTPLGVGMALLVSLLLVENRSGSHWLLSGSALSGAHLDAAAGPRFRVSEAFGDASFGLTQTTSEVAGRVFVLRDDDVWVQRGLDASELQASVPVRSAAGRRLLAELSDLDVLLADGSRVVLRYKLETLELRGGS
jgi:anti-sigma factor RsiW